MFAGVGNVWAQPDISLTLVTGRTIEGRIDADSDSQFLWLRRSDSNIELISRLEWSHIASGRVGTEQMTGDSLREWSEKNKSASRSFAELAANTTRAGSAMVNRTSDTKVAARPVTLVIHAYVGQWDADSQTDGVFIELIPLDINGQICPVAGQVEITLVIEDEKLDGGLSIPLRPEFKQLERKSFKVRPEQFANGPARFQLPFRQSHPEFNPRISPTALVHARLNIPGYKVLEASESNVLIRECSYLRDQMQYYSGQRYQPIESNGQPNR